MSIFCNSVTNDLDVIYFSLQSLGQNETVILNQLIR